jgi:hypothetical protein
MIIWEDNSDFLLIYFLESGPSESCVFGLYMQGICFDRVFLHNPVLSPHPVRINSEAGTPENDIAVYICGVCMHIVSVVYM